MSTNMQSKCKQRKSMGVMAAIAVGAAALMGGCRDERTNNPPRQFLPDMDDSPKFKPQTESAFFEDSRAMRPRVQDTVAFGYSSDPSAPERYWQIADDPAVFEGIDSSVNPAQNGNVPGYVKAIPAAVLDQVVKEFAARNEALPTVASTDDARARAMAYLIQRGHERFNIYCSACHGYNGEGGGTTPDGQGYGGLVGRRWGYAVPSFHDAKYMDRNQKTGQDGYIFNVIRHGVPDADATKPPKMPSYADKVNVRDAWAIVMYVRTLQASWVNSPGTRVADGEVERGSAQQIGAGQIGASNGVQEVNP